MPWPQQELMRACCDGRMEEVQRLVKNGVRVEVNFKDESGWTPLHYAAHEGHTDVVQYLHTNGADLNRADKVGRTPLHQAASGGHMDVVKYLHTNGANTNRGDKLRQTPLHKAAEGGHVDIVQYLHTNGANIYSIRCPGELSRQGNACIKQAIQQVADEKKNEKIRAEEVARSKPAKECEERERRELAKERAEEKEKCKLAKEREEKRKAKLAEKAAEEEEARLAKKIEEERRKAIVALAIGEHLLPVKTRRTAEDWAVKLSEVGDLSQCVDAGTGRSLLHIALATNVPSLYGCLIKSYPDTVMATDKDGRTPLHSAIFYKLPIGVIKKILRIRPELAIATSFSGRTPLHEAAWQGNAAATSLLLNTGGVNVPVTIEDDEGKTPLFLAISRRKAKVAELLATAGAGLEGMDRALSSLTPAAREQMTAVLSAHRAARSSQAEGRLDLHMRDSGIHPLGFGAAVAVNNCDVVFDHSASPVVGSHHHRMAERVRTGEYSVGTDTYFETLHGHGVEAGANECHADSSSLYCALAYADAKDVCVPMDVMGMLRSYEEEVRQNAGAAEKGDDASAAVISVDPLYLLAYARWAELNPNYGASSDIANLLLYRFVEKASGEGGEWLREEEKKRVALFRERLARDGGGRGGDGASGGVEVDPSTSGDGGGGAAAGGDGGADGGCGGSGPHMAEWEAIKVSLTARQREPMEELLSLVGLNEVKRLALSVYRDVLADKCLRDNGKENAIVPRTLNFAFLGNPGTGKTTVAKLFADLLEQAGARAGHKFVQMTAHEAIRMGADRFATALSALTGTQGGVGPPPSTLRKGHKVEIDCDGKWYPATIKTLPSTEAKRVGYTVSYTDNTEEDEVARKRVRALGSGEEVGGVLFLDEAYDLDPESSPVGRSIMAELMAVAENHRDSVTIILAGYKDDIEKRLYASNAGMASRFQSVAFEDFDDRQLGEIWRDMCEKGGWQVGDDVCEVVKMRMGRRSGVKGFGNARSVRKIFEMAVTDAKRNYMTEVACSPANDPAPTNWIRMVDVIGPEPSFDDMPQLREAFNDLDAMVGLGKVKKELHSLFGVVRGNYGHELRGERVDEVVLNRMYLGNPGTGKTTVARIYGRILSALRLLSDGEVVYKTASDFIGEFVGQTQMLTKTIIESAQGRVLLIDEAYNLQDNAFGNDVLNTLVEKVSGAPGEDIAVVLVGYEAPMLKMFREGNAGLSRRFAVASALRFEDMTDSELLRVLSGHCNKFEIFAPIAVKLHAVKLVSKLRSLPNFGNAGEVATLFATAKARRSTRLQQAKANNLPKREIDECLTIGDFDGDIDDRALALQRNPLLPLEEMQEVGTVKQTLRDLGKKLAVLRREGRSVGDIVGHFVFTGPPGTGKTTVARVLCQALHAYGILARPHIEQTTGHDLSGQYVGEAKNIVRQKMEAARGGLLFVDEAYTLGQGQYGAEAMQMFLSLLTEPEYMNGKTIVVFAGYKADMDVMLARNSGLRSRFREYIDFPAWSSEQCATYLNKIASQAKPTPYAIEGVQAVAVVDDDSGRGGRHSPSPDHVHQHGRQQLLEFFTELSSPLRPGWANARDVETMFNRLTGARALRLADEERADHRNNTGANTSAVISTADLACGMAQFLASRPRSNSVRRDAEEEEDMLVHNHNSNNHNSNNYSNNHNNNHNNNHGKNNAKQHSFPSTSAAKRGAAAHSQAPASEKHTHSAHDTCELTGEASPLTLTADSEAEMMSDDYVAALRVMEQSAKDDEEREAAERALAEAEEFRERLEAERRGIEEAEAAQRELMRRIQEERDAEARRRLEEERERLQLEMDLRREAHERMMREERERRETMSKLSRIGKCPQGFVWNREGAGWRCGGGSHWVSDAQLQQHYTY